MTQLPQTNVRLVDISTPGHAGDYNRPPGPAVSKWNGSVGAYLSETIATNLASGPGELNRVRKSTLIIPGTLSPSIDIVAGDIVTYMVPDGATRNWVSITRVVQTFSFPPRVLPGVPTFVRLALIDVAS